MNLEKTFRDRFLAIDANAIVHRAFHAYPSSLQTSEGLQVNAVYGFTVMLLSALKTFDPKYVVCCFDTHKPTFRHLEYPEYKGTRKPTDQSLIDQFPMVEEVLKSFNIPIIKKEGFEADDILGTISKYVSEGKWSNGNLDLYILSGDRDLLQLVNERVKVCLPSGNFKNLVAYDREETFKYLGIYPEQVVDFKAMAGDSSDNIPGVKGLGSKTAESLLREFGDLDGVYRNIGKVKDRYAKLLVEGVEQVEFSRKLATIEKEVDISVKLEDSLLLDFDSNRVVEVFRKYSFKSLIPKLEEMGLSLGNVDSPQLDMFGAKPVSVERVDSIDFSNSSKAVVVYIGEEESLTGEPFFMYRSVDKQGKVKDMVTGPNRSTGIPLGETITYGWEESCLLLEGLKFEKLFDIQLFSHIINSGRKGYSLRDLAFQYSNHTLPEKISQKDLVNVLDAVEEIVQKMLEEANKIELYDYTRKNIEQILRVNEDYFNNVLKKVEIPTSIVLRKMEERGIMVDVQYLKKVDEDIKGEIENISKEIYESIGHEFNINSPKQLSDVLFNELGLPRKKKSSTRESVLSELVGSHPCVEKILMYRELNKVYSTYTNPILEMSLNNPENTIHTDFKQTGTTSGRLSSANPNMQNIPVQGVWAEKLRKSFIPRKGFVFVGMDYSQIELRIMADISQDNLLIEDFVDGLDIHKATASRIMGKEMEDVTKEERSLGKTVNFGILFGQTAYGLSSMLGIDVEKASEYIQSYFSHYLGVEEYIRSLEKEAYKRGYVQSILGTTRFIQGLKSRNIRMIKAAQREAVNMPIQGSEADIMKLAMISMDDAIEEEFKGKAYILLQIHDELIFEVKEDLSETFALRAKETMEEIISLEVPLSVNYNIGKNLASLK